MVLNGLTAKNHLAQISSVAAEKPALHAPEVLTVPTAKDTPGAKLLHRVGGPAYWKCKNPGIAEGPSLFPEVESHLTYIHGWIIFNFRHFFSIVVNELYAPCLQLVLMTISGQATRNTSTVE